DGTRLAGTDKKSANWSPVRIWNATTGREVLSIPNSSRAALSLAFSPDGKRLAWGTSEDRSVKVWDLEAWQLRFTLTGQKDMTAGLAFSPDGRRLASASPDRTVRVWDMTRERPGEVVLPLLTLSGHTSFVRSVVFSPDGTQIASASFDRS